MLYWLCQEGIKERGRRAVSKKDALLTRVSTCYYRPPPPCYYTSVSPDAEARRYRISVRTRALYNTLAHLTAAGSDFACENPLFFVPLLLMLRSEAQPRSQIRAREPMYSPFVGQPPEKRSSLLIYIYICSKAGARRAARFEL